MSIYRRTRKDRDGRVKRARVYTAEFSYRGKLHRRNGFVDRESARHWLMSESLKLRRGSSGYIKPMLRAQVMPLIAEYAKWLRSRGRDSMYCYTSEKRLAKLAGECGWMVLGDVTRASIDAWKATGSQWRGKPIVARTVNQYIETAMEFGAWLASEPVAKLPSNPLAGAERLRARANDEYRRSATIEELNRLLAVCDPSRRLYYLFRVYHAKLRSGTLASLTWGMLHLNAAPPFAQTPASINKSRRDEKHPLRYEIAAELRKLRRKSRADELVFPAPPSLEDFRADLKTAGVPLDDGKGNRRLDYHALRATLVQIGKDAGLTAFQVMELMGHRDIRTTMKWYNRATIEPERSVAMEKLPAIGRMRRA